MKNTIQSINPYTEEVNAEFELLDDTQIENKIKIAHEGYQEWKRTPRSEKKKLFLQLADVIESDLEAIAKLQTLEMGMLDTESVGGVKGTVKLIRWFANNFEEILGEEEFETEGLKGKYMYDPLGVIFGVAPWNFPYNQVLRAAIPNILAGNTVIYKHASNVPMCAQKLEDLFRQAGFREGIYTNMLVSSSKTEFILSNDYIAGVNLTGGEGAGKVIGSIAGNNLKPSVLELGGNDAFIVCDTDNLDEIVEAGAQARMANGGQKCNSSKRFIVLEKYYDEFCEKFAKKFSELQAGDPMDHSTTIPPLAKKGAVKDIENQVSKTVSEGAELLVGGKAMDRKGFFFAPTVLKNVTADMTSYKEEVFGPVASIIKSSSIEESIKIANDSDFGLCGCVYGDNQEQLIQVASQVETGMIFINKPAGSKASLPFGGVKKSGYGKENGPDGLKAFTNKKVVLY
ncbi:aldehyde dehydrogenase family protein [Candidatus Gracilibacteria bacterium 28_42_T64]|nr:aldehyde dehydrogenase family protein [Candidatus Gracilibacteria bacterium 28_42_T64]